MTYLRSFTARLKAFFGFAGDPYPETPATIARAKAANAADRIQWDVDDEGKRRRLHGLSEIITASQENARVVYFGEERRRLLAKSLIDECGQVTGPAWTFERREK